VEDRRQRGAVRTVSEGREGRRGGTSPLESDRGITSIKSTVVERIAGLAAQEVEGVHMGGGASRATLGLLGGAAGSQDQTRGVSAEVGRTEAAIDLTMAVDYGPNILQTVGRVRDRITARVEPLTGLRITELNVTISDVVFLEDGGSARDDTDDTTRTLPRRELRPGARERGYTEVTPRERTHTESRSGPVPEEEVRVQGGPLAEDQTVELRLDKEEDGEERRER
jgi:uncharacterized alkaline shock family protein YloU